MGTLKLGNLEFEWDDVKAASNLSKHGVSFPEAATAFLDANAEIDCGYRSFRRRRPIYIDCDIGPVENIDGNARCARLAIADYQCAACYSK